MKVILLGFGTVGMGLAQALAEKHGVLLSKAEGIDIVAVSDSESAVMDARGLDPSVLVRRKRSTGMVGEEGTRPDRIVRDIECDVVVELTPGNPKSGEPALTHIRDALEAGRHVVTANKMPLALHYWDLIGHAEKSGVQLRYGACVGGGLPLLEMGRACAAAEDVDGFDAILNATSNFILTSMGEGSNFESALAEAQRLGYAEADPSLDIDGMDAAAKLVILANHALGRRLSLGDVNPLRGIREITSADLRSAASRKKVLKPIARVGDTAEVGPIEVAAGGPLNIPGHENVAVFRCHDSGERVVRGPTGGGIRTSRAVLRDLVAISSARAER